MCQEHDNEEPCQCTPETPVEYTFLEPYCSDTCETYFEDSITHTNLDIVKDRLTYVDGAALDTSLPITTISGNLLVDFERVKLVYKGLLDLIDVVYGENDKGGRCYDAEIEFPLTILFPAHAVALFLKSRKSERCEAHMFEFLDMELQHKVQILQRLMAAMSTGNNLRTHSVQGNLDSRIAERDRSHDWETYKEDVGFGDLSHLTKMPGPIDWADEQILPVIKSLVSGISDFEDSEDYHNATGGDLA